MPDTGTPPLDPDPGGDALGTARAAVRAAIRLPEGPLVARLAEAAALGTVDREAIVGDAARMVRDLRGSTKPGMMEAFLGEYGLSTAEGLALMCLAEALLRVPDAATMDALIADKIAPGDWAAHFGHSASTLVNGSTLGLALTGRVLGRDTAGGVLQGAARRLGRPVIRTAVTAAMREMGRQFVLGQTIEEASERGGREKGLTYSYDMLGEAATTAADAAAFARSYAGAIAALAPRCTGDIRDNPGVSVKLSALHPRYETAQKDRVMTELVPVIARLTRQARDADMGLNIDAEEAGRLDLSLDVIAAVLADPALAGWDGFGVVVQAYGKRAMPVIDWLEALAHRLDRRIMVRLVKGAYWDAEIKLAQVEGLEGYPVFTRKAATDVSYLACARRLLGAERIYPQFATHNAHSVAAILRMAGNDTQGFEFQRLHGMGETLHDTVRRRHGTRLRIYAPVGRHKELLAYLVRRLLENGANSSFVNRMADPDVPAEEVVADPFGDAARPSRIAPPRDLFAPRANSRGWDLDDPVVLASLDAGRAPFRTARWTAAPMLATGEADGTQDEVLSPVDPGDVVGTRAEADAAIVARAVAGARPWDAPAPVRGDVLRGAADALEAAHAEIFALLAREAGKTLPDAIAELREAVDFLRYYADEAAGLPVAPGGTFACVAPWNFPLAIFVGQVAAALAAGNAVLAKPAPETPLIAALATRAMLDAGVPRAALQFLPGGGDVGAALTSDPGIDGCAFTGSTATAQAINRAMAANADPHAPLIAETGGLNAMIVDSTALPEQAVRDIVDSAFRSAGQRCSALRVLYVQEEMAEGLLEMLTGAMDALRLGDPWDPATDIGPVITRAARDRIAAHVDAAAAEGRLIHRLPDPGGCSLGPAAIRVGGIADLEQEVFGPVLHVATFRAGDLGAVVEAINASGYGLTFGLHTRISARAEDLPARVHAGNAYVNRNQIGAIVGSQPFGGEGLSGTGPKAGGPRYLPRFRVAGPAPVVPGADDDGSAPVAPAALQRALGAAVSPPVALPVAERPGPTGESNVTRLHPRGTVLCLGPGAEAALAQAAIAAAQGCAAVAVAPGLAAPHLDGRAEPGALIVLEGVAAVAHDGGPTARAVRRALAERTGPIVPLLRGDALRHCCVVERHVCTDTTAAGGNATLMSDPEGR